MKKFFLLLTFAGFLFASYGQRVQGTIKPGANSNEVIVAIKPTVAFNGQISNLIVSVQIPTSVGARPSVSNVSLQPTLFSNFVQLDADQGDAFYTWGFNCTALGASNSDAAPWSATELDVIKITFTGATVPPFTARLSHYLDGGNGNNAIFYVETNLAAVNGGVLSDWGNLFYGAGASNGAAAAGNIGIPNAQYSFTTVGNVTLPVKFLGFNVTKKDKDALLTWQIENESALTDRYEILRSINGVDFKKVYSIAAKNNGSTSNSYDYTEYNLPALRSGGGVIYYRVKQFDKDGNFILTPIKNVRLDGKGLSIGVYPNPIKDYANLSFDLLKDGKVTLTINDASGKQVQNISMQLFKGLNIKKINMSSFAAGSYLLKVNTGDEILTVSLVKAN